MVFIKMHLAKENNHRRHHPIKIFEFIFEGKVDQGYIQEVRDFVASNAFQEIRPAEFWHDDNGHLHQTMLVNQPCKAQILGKEGLTPEYSMT